MKEQQQDEQLIYYYNMNDQDIVEIIYETDEVETIEAVRNNQGEISFRTQVKLVRQELIDSNRFPANSGSRMPKPVPEPVSRVVPDHSRIRTRYGIRPSFPRGIPITDPVVYLPGQDTGNTPSFPLQFPREKISRVIRL
jgi:hypothetical protein